MAECDHALAQVRRLRFGPDTTFVSIPAGYFVEHGLFVKPWGTAPQLASNRPF
ncbi:MAG: hypothetical protein GXP25_06990 [Planctomycetes bacterium]|nr:hypothetical protein [Planctomycetota bacterium]